MHHNTWHDLVGVFSLLVPFFAIATMFYFSWHADATEAGGGKDEEDEIVRDMPWRKDELEMRRCEMQGPGGAASQ